jgi:GrpB-like predicted nucleotidyltransferase (UPF0157 family)
VPTPEDITRHHEWDARDAADIWVDAPPQPEVVEIVDYDPAWPAVFDAVAGRIRQALGGRVLALGHVGSTAVPGLAAKPVIDVDLTVADSSDEGSYVADLQRIGFELTIREPGWHEHRLFKGDRPRVNLHVFSPECPETVRHLMFREWLRTHPEDADRYVDAKRVAATAATTAGESVMDYNLRKEAVIREIYARMFAAHGLL